MPVTTSGALTVGQPWEEAVAVIASAGYVLQDGDELQMAPAPAGYVELAGDRALVIDRDDPTNAVSYLQEFERWSAGKNADAQPRVDEFSLPARW